MLELNGALRWNKSSRCDTANCVEVASGASGAMVRDSKESDGPVLSFGRPGWGNFIDQIRVDGLGPR